MNKRNMKSSALKKIKATLLARFSGDVEGVVPVDDHEAEIIAARILDDLEGV